MNMLFDASSLFNPHKGGGVYNYLVKLLPLLNERVILRGGRLRLFNLYMRRKPEIPANLAEIERCGLRLPVRLMNKLWIDWRFPDLSHLYRDADLFHSPHFTLPIISRAKKILTVNDIAYLKNSGLYTEKGRELNEYGYRKLLSANILRADRIIAISAWTKNDLVEYFDIDPDRVSVVHIGCDLVPEIDRELVSKAIEPFGAELSRYIYFPAGTFEPRKNIEKTVESFLRANPEPGGIKLLISGVGDRQFLGAGASNPDVKIVKWKDDAERNALYQGALFIVYPSLYEGFGMPLTEAFGNGKAVLCSDGSSLGEVAGDFALKVSAENADEIASGMERLFSDSALRRSLESRARERAAHFSWDRMADETFAIYEDAISR